MTIFTFDGQFKVELLADEILVAMPELIETVNGIRWCRLYLGRTATGITIDIPDGFDTSPIASVIQAHNPNMLTAREVDKNYLDSVIAGLSNIPNWATWNSQEASDYIQGAILSGRTQAQITTQIGAIANLADAKVALQSVADALLAIRTILIGMAQLLVFIRIIINRVIQRN